MTDKEEEIAHTFFFLGKRWGGHVSGWNV